MPRSPTPAPDSEHQLMGRAAAMAGATLGEIAGSLGLIPPTDLLHNKGWIGQLFEQLLGADAHSLPEPDFRHLGIELKSLPIDRQGRPRETTYVCNVPMLGEACGSWEESWVRNKLQRVLWVPFEGERDIPIALRRIGAPLLWSPSTEEEELLRRDWEELTEIITMGEIESISARMGVALQIRPKAAHSRILSPAIGPEGELIHTNPRGWYLRTSFTNQLLRHHYI